MYFGHRLNRTSGGLQRFQRPGRKQHGHLFLRELQFGLGRLTRWKKLRLEQQHGKQENVKRDGREPRNELPLGLLFSLLGHDQLNFPGTENVRADEVFRHMQRVGTHFRRCGAQWHGDALVHVGRLQRSGMVFRDAVGFAMHIAGHDHARGNGLERQIRGDRRMAVQLHDGQHGRHQRALIHGGGTAALCWRIHRRGWTSIDRN